MQGFRDQFKKIGFLIGIAILLAGASLAGTAAPVAAQGETTAENSPAADILRPFHLPFAEPPGLDTWLMAQPYGNTTGAYRQRFTTYGASGGIHFGLDLSAPCGTEVVAMADGIVFAVDGPFGSPPHNLMIDHPQLGYASMYGHLLQASHLRPGDVVRQGQVVALTGDSGETCYGRPHLHLEIRDLAHITKYNPITLIEANWDNLALLGDSARDFARDLDEPRKWQSLYDQPQARTAGPIVNDFANPWPLDWEKGVIPPEESTLETTTLLTETESVVVEPLRRLPAAWQLTAGDCCTQFYWAAVSGQIRYIDQPDQNAPLGLWEVDPLQPQANPQFVSARLGLYSPDGKWFAYPDRESGLVVIERLATGKQRLLDTKGRSPSFTPDSQSVMWTDYDEDAPRDTREETIWLANVAGGTPRSLISARRVSRVAWLANDLWLMTRRIAGSSDQELFTFSLVDGSQETLVERLPRLRSVALSPNKRYMVYYVAFESAAENGVWLYDLKFPSRAPRKLPFFGTYRWQDDRHLIYVPFEPEATEYNFYEFDLLTRQTRQLFPAGTGLTIANNEWRVSPDGRRLALLAADGQKLDGIWVLDLAQNPES